MLTRPFVVLWISMLIAMAGISMVSPLLPVHVQDDLGGPPLAVALSFSGLAIAQIIGAPFVGRLGDLFGPKRFIVIGFAIYALGALGYLFAPTWELVVFFRVLSGVGAAAVFPMSLAYIGRMSPPGGEGRYMGWFAVAQTGGFGIGPLFGGGLRDAFGSDAAFATMALLLGGAALLTLIGLPSERSLRQKETPEAADARAQAAADGPVPYRVLLRRPSVVGATLLVALLGASWGSASAWLAVFVIDAQGLGTNSALFAGLLLSSRGLVSAALQPFTGPLADRQSRVLLVAIGLVVSGLSVFAIPLVPRTLVETSILGPAMTMAPWVLAMLLLAGIAESLATPAQQAIFVQIGRRGGMGSLMGLNAMGNAIGFLSGSLIGALVKDMLGIEAVFSFAGIVTIGGMVAFVFLMTRDGEVSAPAQAPSPGPSR
jgi:DHA1 family multidrug resistance protein-like MFS transporter